MKTADWILVAVATVLMALAAVISAYRQRSAIEYFTAGRRMRRTLMVLFAFGSGTASDSQSSVLATTWQWGLSGLWWQFLWLPITPFYWFAAPLLRRLRAVTTADFFSIRFGPATGVLYAIYGMVISIVLMAGILFGGARLIDRLTDPVFTTMSQQLDGKVPVVDLVAAFQPPSPDRPPIIIWKSVSGENLAACVLAFTILVITAVGGLRSAILIDAAQGILRIGLTFLLLWLILGRIGGYGTVRQMHSLKPGMLDFVASATSQVAVHQEAFTPFYLSMLAVAGLAGIIVQPQIFAVCGAGRTEMDSRIGFTFGNLLKRTMAVAWAFTGLACIVWYLGETSPLNSAAASPADRALYSELRLLASGQVGDMPAPRIEQLNAGNAAFADFLFARVVRDLLGDMVPGLLGLVVVMAMTAAVSHCGTQLVVGSGLFADHLYKHHLAPGRQGGHYAAIARMCSPVLIAVALLLQTTFSDLTDALRLVIKTPAVIGVSMWMGLIWTRWNTASVWVTTVSATTVGILCRYFPEEIRRSLPGLSDIMFTEQAGRLIMFDGWKIACILGSGLFCGILAALLTEPQSEGQLELFYRLIRTPVGIDETDYSDQFVPSDDTKLAPAVSFLGFQLPGPTRVGVVGFVLAWLIVAGIVICTKLLSLNL